MSDATITDIITILCDDPAELRRVFGPLAELPAWWRYKMDDSTMSGTWRSREEAEKSRENWLNIVGPYRHRRNEVGPVFPVTPAARLADLKAGIE